MPPRRALRATLLMLFALAVIPARATAGVPLAERREALARGNLLSDGSFEAGGKGWLLLNARLTADRPFAGERSLRLTAHTGGHARAVTLVPVIPGLYSLSAAVRLTGIRPPAGMVLADRFHTRVTWLDKNRRVLSPAKDGQAGYERRYPMAFLHEAPEALWQRAVFVSSYEDPAGDEAPAGAAYARISFLLEGPGRVEIDDVRFAYNRRNLQLSERVAIYRDLDMDALGRVIPTPRHLAEHGPKISFHRLCVSHPGAPPPGLADRLKAFEARLRELGATMIRTWEGGDAPGRCDLNLHLAPADRKSAAWMSDLVNEARDLPPEGYVIHTRAGSDGRPALIAAGADGAGLVYALETIRQLLRPAPSGAAAIRATEVRDWPAFQGRSLAGWEPGPPGMRMIIEASHWIVGIKLNRLYLNYPLRTPRWWQPPDTYRALVQSLGERARRTDLYALGILLNPYAQRSEPEITDTFQISRREDVDILLSEITRTVEAGARIVMLCLDDFVPSREGHIFAYHLDDPQDRMRFASLAEAHLWLIDRLRTRLRAIAPDATLTIVPPWYNERFRAAGGDDAEHYMREMAQRLPPDVGVVWTGPTVRSRIVDDMSTAGFSGAIGGRSLLLWDNSVWELELSKHYAGSPDRAALVSLFEPFHIETGNLSGSSFRGEFYFNGSSGGRFLAKAMTLADYLWNPEAYDPDLSIWRAMVFQWGRESAGLLLDWDTAYWQERSWINRLAASRGTSRKEARAQLQRARARSSARWEAVKRALGERSATLRGELEAWVQEQEAHLRKAKEIAAANP